MNIDTKLPVTERLSKMVQAKSKIKGINDLRYAVVTQYGTNGNNLQNFSNKLPTGLWRGVLVTSRGGSMGTIFAWYNNKFTIIRGFPKINYADNEDVYHENVYLEEKIDGTNLNFWTFHDGSLMCKTRLSTRADVQGYRGRIFMNLFKETGLTDNIQKLCNKGYQVIGELYGTKNPGDFIQYSKDIDFKVIDIIDRKDFSFVPRTIKELLCEEFGLPVVNLLWKGTFTKKVYDQYMFDLKKYLTLDGLEGAVVKWYNHAIGDQIMAKIKTQEISERSWSLSGGKRVPKSMILKAVKKASEKLGEYSRQELYDEIIEELNEEFNEDMILRSKHGINECITDYFANSKTINQVLSYLKSIKKMNIQDFDINKPNDVMPLLASNFLGFTPTQLFTIYNRFRQDEGLVK